MVEYFERINDWLDIIFQFGAFWVYLAILFACFIENIFPPFPGDTFIVAAGVLVGLGRLDLYWSLFSILAGGVTSVYLIYLFGKLRGREFFIKRNYKLFSEEDINKSEKYFNKYGSIFIIISRFTVGVRTVLTLVSGISRYNPIKMITYSTISYLLFSGVLIYASIKTVENIELLDYYLKTYYAIVFPLLIIALVFYIIYKLKLKRKNGQ